MKLSIQMTLVFAAVFASICLAVAIKGFLTIPEMTDPEKVSDAWGFAFFWTFLGVMGLAIGLFAWWLVRTQPRDGT